LHAALAGPQRVAKLPKTPLDFHALLEKPTPAGAYRELNFPMLILRGEHAPATTRVIAVSELLPASPLIAIGGAGHIGPLTHARELSVRHIVDADGPPRRWPPRRFIVISDAAQRRAEAVS
jgi:hypothetical protein